MKSFLFHALILLPSSCYLNVVYRGRKPPIMHLLLKLGLGPQQDCLTKCQILGSQAAK